MPTSAIAIAIGVANPAHHFPVLVEHTAPAGPESLDEWWRANKPWVDAQLREHGALLLRGFDVADRERFERFVHTHSPRLCDYRDGNSPRTNLGGGVYTSTEYPAEFFISLHNELSYSSRWPARLWFCCVVEPQEGGETALVDSRALLASLDPAIVEEFRRKGVCYIRNLHGGRGYGASWQKTYGTESRDEVERFVTDAGMQYQWRGDGNLRVWQVRPAIAAHPVTGEEVWFNQADQFHPSTHPKPVLEALMKLCRNRLEELPQSATYGDGTPIDIAALDAIRETTRQNIVLFPWRQGDLLVVDNMLVAHGRMPFKGPRRILVSMSEA